MSDLFRPATPLPMDDSELLLDHLCDKYESLLKSDRDASFEELLSEIEKALVPSLFQELLILRLAYPTSDGTRGLISSYLRRYPEYEDIILNAYSHYNEASQTLTPTLFSVASQTDDTVDDLEDLQHVYQLGKYPVIGHLKSGGQGDVFLARHPTLGKVVVIKVLKNRVEHDSTRQDRLIREGQILANAQHPNIVQVHDLDFHDGRPFLVMEFVEGPTLSSYLRTQSITEATAIRWVSAISEALIGLHEQHVVHRDITPNNILIRDGEPVLIDFGLALDAKLDHATATGLAGTVPYMAPEQVLAPDRPITPATDVFALGGLLLYLLTGKSVHRLINAENDVELHHVARFSDNQLAEALPNNEFRNLLLNCLSSSTTERFQDATQLLAALNAIKAPTNIINRRSVLTAAGLGALGFTAFQLFDAEEPVAPEDLHYLPPPEGDFTLVFRLTDETQAQYLQSWENALLKTEEGLGVAKYWMPSTANQEGIVTYRVPIPFEIGSARLTVRTHTYPKLKFGDRFADSASVILEASSDGLFWQTFHEHRHTDEANAQNGPYDISHIVAGGTEVYLRARLLTDTNWPGVGPIFAQFMRTPFSEEGDQTNCFRLSVTACGE